MSWWKEVTHIGHHVSHAVDHTLHEANKIGHKIFGGGPGHEEEGGISWHVGYNSNDGFDFKVGPEAETYMQQKLNEGITPPERQINDDNYQAAMVEQSRPQTVIGNIMNGQGYSRTTAKTANTLAQGGMTKDEVEAFNMKHPNETANTGD